MCEQGAGPGLSFPIPFFPRPFIISHIVFVDVKRHKRQVRQLRRNDSKGVAMKNTKSVLSYDSHHHRATDMRVVLMSTSVQVWIE